MHEVPAYDDDNDNAAARVRPRPDPDPFLARIDAVEAHLGSRVQRVEDRLEAQNTMINEMRETFEAAGKTLASVDATLRRRDEREQLSWDREQARLKAEDERSAHERDVAARLRLRAEERKDKVLLELWGVIKQPLATFLAVALGGLTAGGIGYQVFRATGLPTTPTPVHVEVAPPAAATTVPPLFPAPSVPASNGTPP